MMLGVFADGWAHTNILDELESFITPWHGIIFAGFLAATAVVVKAIVRRIPDTGSWRAAIPAGWAQATVGVALFGAFFVGDGIWHTAFGIEADLEALLSPTHLLGLIGASAIFAAPMASEWQRFPGRSGSFRQLAPVVSSALLLTFGAAFFSMWAWFITLGFPAAQFEEVVRRSGDFAVVSARSWGMASYLMTTLWLVGPLLLVLRRWDLPRGAASVLIVVPNLLLLAIQEFGGWPRMVPVVMAAIATEWYLARYRPGPDRLTAARLLGMLLPGVLFTLDMVTLAVWLDLGWEPEFVAGSVMVAALLGWALGFLAFPPAMPAAARSNQE